MRSMFTKSKETSALQKLFRTLSINAPISFADASKKLGFKVTSSTSAYNSARRIAEREDSLVIEGIRGFGFKRMPGEEIAQSAPRDFRSIRRRAARAARKQEIAIGQNLDSHHMNMATVAYARLRLIADTSQTPRTNRPKPDAPEQAAPVDARERLRALSS